MNEIKFPVQLICDYYSSFVRTCEYVCHYESGHVDNITVLIGLTFVDISEMDHPYHNIKTTGNQVIC